MIPQPGAAMLGAVGVLLRREIGLFLNRRHSPPSALEDQHNEATELIKFDMMIETHIRRQVITCCRLSRCDQLSQLLCRILIQRAIVVVKLYTFPPEIGLNDVAPARS